jgi:hypothetical protein
VDDSLEEEDVSVIEAELKRHDRRADMDACTLDLLMFIEHIFNLVHCWIRMV